jgi:hypothetical protein
LGCGSGQLLGGDLQVYVDNGNGDLTSDELARIQDAVTTVDAVTAPYGVTVEETTDPTQTEVTLDMAATSPVGGYADGILGCFDPTAGQITMIQGWNWYAGSDATQIGASLYDFQTTVTHELGHALGLGENADPTSAMSGTLATATVIRTLTTADLNIPEAEAGADAQRAAVSVERISTLAFEDVGRIGNPSSDDGRDMLFAILTTDLARNAVAGSSDLAARDTVFSNGLASGQEIQSVSLATNFGHKGSDPIFAGQALCKEVDGLLDESLFLTQDQNGRHETPKLTAPGATPVEALRDFMPADEAFLEY